MTDDQKNSQAYQDCLDCKEPTMPDDPIYMAKYRGWRNLAKFPGDDYEVEQYAILKIKKP